MPAGRPRVHDRKAILLELCEEMGKGENGGLNAICAKLEHFPAPQVIYSWLDDKELNDIFMRAQERWCWAQREKMIEIADDDSRDILEVEESYVTKSGELKTYTRRTSDNTAVNRDKLRIGARQWAMAKLVPKLFGDKVEQRITDADGKSLSIIVNVNAKKNDKA